MSNNIYLSIDKATVLKQAIELPTLGPKDVLLRVTHSSLCATDLAYLPYGIAMGHEGVGIVEKVGTEVSALKVGDRAGGGYHRNSCGHCKYCLTGQDIWCYERTIFGEGDFANGTFADYYIGKESYLHKIPETIPAEFAAPLQCAGSTVYTALIKNVKAGSRVGIIGIGGLGHLAIQFAAKMGAQVAVFSTKANKEAEARSFGANEFYLLSETSKVKVPLDVLVLAGSKYPDWNEFLVKEVLARQGVIVPLGAPETPDAKLDMSLFGFFFAGYNIHSSLVASRQEHEDMLAFAAQHQIRPKIETFPFTEAGFADATKKLRDGTIRYRGVLVA